MDIRGTDSRGHSGDGAFPPLNEPGPVPPHGHSDLASGPDSSPGHVEWLLLTDTPGYLTGTCYTGCRHPSGDPWEHA